MEKILEGNKLIAEFMGRKFKAYNDNRFFDREFDTYDECERWIGGMKAEEGYKPELGWKLGLGKYHESWDWLMPSWGKVCSSLLEIADNAAYSLIDQFKDAAAKVDIAEAWDVVVRAIKFINE